MELGNKILELRKNKRLSQEKLGEKLGVTRQTVSNWELGITMPNLEQLKKISKEFNVSVDELIGNDTKEMLIEKVSNTEKLAGLVLKIIKIYFIVSSMFLLLILLFVFLFRFTKRNKTSVSLNTREDSIYCTLYGEEHGYTIEYYENSDMVISMGGDTYFSDILDLGKYEYAHQIFNVINDYVKKNGGTCEMIKDRDLSDLVNIEITDLTNTSMRIIIHDNNHNKLVYGSDFYIERYNNMDNSWKSVEENNENYGFDAMAYYVDKDGILEMKQDWTHMYGSLNKGIYRIVKNVFFESDVTVKDDDKFYVWAEFEIE